MYAPGDQQGLNTTLNITFRPKSSAEDRPSVTIHAMDFRIILNPPDNDVGSPAETTFEDTDDGYVNVFSHAGPTPPSLEGFEGPSMEYNTSPSQQIQTSQVQTRHDYFESDEGYVVLPLPGSHQPFHRRSSAPDSRAMIRPSAQEPPMTNHGCRVMRITLSESPPRRFMNEDARERPSSIHTSSSSSFAGRGEKKRSSVEADDQRKQNKKLRHSNKACKSSKSSSIPSRLP